jgi:hypothetical protein
VRSRAPLLVVTLAVPFIVTSCAQTTSSSAPPATTQQAVVTPATKLAAKTGESVSAVRRALIKTDFDCKEGKGALAREVSNSLDDLANNGIKESAVAFLNEIDKSAATIAPTDCVQIQAALLVLMEQ